MKQSISAEVTFRNSRYRCVATGAGGFFLETAEILRSAQNDRRRDEDDGVGRSGIWRKAPGQEHSLVMDKLNILSIGSGGEAGFISGHGFFQMFARLYIAFLAGLKSSAKHPLIKGPQSSA